MDIRVKRFNQQGLINCDKCKLNSFKALSWGNPLSLVMFVGNAPTHTIDEHRLCFQSHQFKPLFLALKELGHRSESYFYTNLIRCSVPNNRQLRKEEKNNCRGILQQELETSRPHNIICFGKEAGDSLFGVQELYTPTEIFYPFNATVHTVPHPSYVNRFWDAEYEKFKSYLSKVLS